MHPLHEVLVSAAGGHFPPADGGVDVLPPDDHGAGAVVELTGHAFVLTERDPDAVLAAGADGFGGASQPDLVRWLAGAGGWVGSHDAVLVARGRGTASGTVPLLAPRHDLDDHPRVVRSRDHRRNVEVHGDDVGFVTLGDGLVGRREISVELLAVDRGDRGEGRRLIAAALALVPEGELLWAQVAPGNAASLRSFLSCGFAPIGAEILLG
jgi:hypothetical protein